MGSHMGMMETVEARGGIMPEVIAFISHKGPATAAGIVEEIIVAPIAVIIWAVIAVVITVVVYRPACSGTAGQYEQHRSAQDHFKLIVHDKPLGSLFIRSRPASVPMVVVSVTLRNIDPSTLIPNGDAWRLAARQMCISDRDDFSMA
jgi:hypothetical protein